MGGDMGNFGVKSELLEFGFKIYAGVGCGFAFEGGETAVWESCGWGDMIFGCGFEEHGTYGRQEVVKGFGG